MLRRVLFALAGVALAAFLATDRAPKATAADDDIAGSWMLRVYPASIPREKVRFLPSANGFCDSTKQNREISVIAGRETPFSKRFLPG